MTLAEGRSYVRRRKEEGGGRRINTGDSASFELPPNRPDGLGIRALLLPALVALYAWGYKSRGDGSGVRDEEMLEDFVRQQAASFGQANGIFGSFQQFLFF